ncbi:Asp-tRNA(Asn)/Glu-tRNA(Gln) amidotransferase subunit GatC [Patescibacteria group bacterium]|nr:Asp-tRNA(Asn)/Glu-tRNA(Gln) amidotransferase subunit GatC [Patescibacteria group bacterium]MBU0777285.1 Asp-tRNA(Asn)/Glu-tRNA(Gln) amidotransferase subunit GatC [Patescibacteria group bacterium]MBU0845731.1 Asp-tRNA(Asn)/Glu-tRNA(Gln) amidotransferase subunit GatC [Patescibacteria group bacterium]MBU0923038.1 Asp-tRNA(Asn)/Glu-tRNA(Gln) amidotransferase subunit GatC [Patescibacteria group bacterium]MBU1066589.1 Asp-tRNA(Asn)/Glu-tRNA(Gln) amidotransferase subunit GatC [Patescibacteria group
MSKISKKDVEHVAKLAKLKITDSEINKFSKQLSEIISYVKELDKADTSNTDPTSQTIGLENVSRQDNKNLENVLSQDEALSGTETDHNGYFVVDAVFQPTNE